MAIAQGYILLYRSLADNWAWKDPHFLKAWLWMLFSANFDERQTLIAGNLLTIKRGELITSLNSICSATGLSMKRARTFLKNLEKTAMIRQEKGNKWTKISICNYDSYQGIGQSNGSKPALNGANRGQTEGNTINKGKKEKEEINNIPFSKFIFLFNNITGRDFKGDAPSQTHFAARVKEGYNLEHFQKAISNCLTDPFHADNPNYLTPEFITRSDKLEKYLNYIKPQLEKEVVAVANNDA